MAHILQICQPAHSYLVRIAAAPGVTLVVNGPLSRNSVPSNTREVAIGHATDTRVDVGAPYICASAALASIYMNIDSISSSCKSKNKVK